MTDAHPQSLAIPAPAACCSAETIQNLPADLRQRLAAIVDAQAQEMVQQMPRSTAAQIDQFKSDFWQQLDAWLSKMLAEKIVEYMQTSEFEAAMEKALRSRKIPLLFSQQLGLAGEIIDQRLELFFSQYAKDLQTLCKLNAQERERAIEHYHQSIRQARMARFEWAIAFSQWWRLLIAGAVGAIAFAPVWMNVPALVGCDRADWVCMTLRLKQPKWVR